jgi:hypothetical protein
LKSPVVMTRVHWAAARDIANKPGRTEMLMREVTSVVRP